MSDEKLGVASYSMDVLDAYVKHRIKPGGFLNALLSGDFELALKLADTWNKTTFFGIMYYIVNHLPEESYGSEENFNAWIENREVREGE